MDSLDLLRRAIQSGGDDGVTRDEKTGDIVLTASNMRISGKTPTRLASGKDGSWYTIETLWFAFSKRGDTVPAYLKASKEIGIPSLFLPDRRNINQFLLGTASNIKNLHPFTEFAPHLREFLRKEQEQQREQKQPDTTVTEKGKEAESSEARQQRKQRKEECRQQMATRLHEIRASMALGVVDAEDSSANSEFVGFDSDKIADLRLKKLLKRQRIDDSLPDPRPDSGLYRDYVDLDKSVVESVERSEHALCPREAALDAEFGKNITIDVNIVQRKKMETNSNVSAAGHLHGQLSSVSRSAGSGKKVSPIIIVPSSLTSPVTLGNVKTFLEKGIWMDPQTTSSSHSSHVEVMHEIHSANAVVTTHSAKIPFRVFDSPAKLSPSDWDYVVAAFLIGAPWQFRDWKWKAANEVLSNMAGFYIKFDAEPLPPAIGTWNVTVLKMSRGQRYLDADAQRLFWNAVEEFIRSKKPHLYTV